MFDTPVKSKNFITSCLVLGQLSYLLFICFTIAGTRWPAWLLIVVGTTGFFSAGYAHLQTRTVYVMTVATMGKHTRARLAAVSEWAGTGDTDIDDEGLWLCAPALSGAPGGQCARAAVTESG